MQRVPPKCVGAAFPLACERMTVSRQDFVPQHRAESACVQPVGPLPSPASIDCVMRLLRRRYLLIPGQAEFALPRPELAVLRRVECDDVPLQGW